MVLPRAPGAAVLTEPEPPSRGLPPGSCVLALIWVFPVPCQGLLPGWMEGAVAAAWMGFYHGVGLNDCKCITLDHVGPCATTVLPGTPRTRLFIRKQRGFHGKKRDSCTGGKEQHSVGMGGGIPAVLVPSGAMGTKGIKTVSEGRININHPLHGEEYFRLDCWESATKALEVVAKAGSNHIIYNYVEMVFGCWYLCCPIPLMLPVHPTP